MWFLLVPVACIAVFVFAKYEADKAFKGGINNTKGDG